LILKPANRSRRIREEHLDSLIFKCPVQPNSAASLTAAQTAPRAPGRSPPIATAPDTAARQPAAAMEKLGALKEIVDSIGKDSSKFFEKGNKAAGTRARKSLQELKKLAQELRVAIQDTKAGMSAGGAGGDHIPADQDGDPDHDDDAGLNDVGHDEAGAEYDD
jgi:hypothetical protein